MNGVNKLFRNSSYSTIFRKENCREQEIIFPANCSHPFAEYEESTIFRRKIGENRKLVSYELPEAIPKYTLTDGESRIEIIAFVLDIVDHGEYNKKFGYKKH